MPEASWSVPQMKSEAGVAANSMPFCRRFSPAASTPPIGLEPDFTIEPSDFSTMLASPPFLLPGVVLALRSAPPRQITVIPGHLADQRLADVFVDRPARQKLDGV